MQDRIRREIAELETEYPAYQCWHVPVYIGPDSWCAKRHDGTGKAIVRYSPAELAEAILRDIEDRGGQQ